MLKEELQRQADTTAEARQVEALRAQLRLRESEQVWVWVWVCV